MQGNIKRIIKFLLTAFLLVIGIKFFIYLLPFIIVGLLIYWLYLKIKDKFGKEKSDDIKKTVRSNIRSKDVLEGEIIREVNEQE